MNFDLVQYGKNIIEEEARKKETEDTISQKNIIDSLEAQLGVLRAKLAAYPLPLGLTDYPAVKWFVDNIEVDEEKKQYVFEPMPSITISNFGSLFQIRLPGEIECTLNSETPDFRALRDALRECAIKLAGGRNDS